MPYRSLIVKYSTQAGLDPFLVAALIRQESEFNPKALSPAKAVGLMQIMPDSGRELARKVAVRGFRTSKLTSPDINIRLGTYYFRRLLDSCDGKVEDALAAYNAGRSRVTLWRGWGPFEDISEFAETIPFAQTRDYVQIILRNAELYRWLYASEPLAPEKEPAAAPKASLKAAASAHRKPAPAVVETSETSDEKPARRSAKAPRKPAPAVAETSEASEKPAKRAASASKKSSKGASASSKKSSEEPAPKSPKAKKKRPKHKRPSSE
jgi:hypothetical protein